MSQVVCVWPRCKASPSDTLPTEADADKSDSKHLMHSMRLKSDIIFSPSSLNRVQDGQQAEKSTR